MIEKLELAFNDKKEILLNDEILMRIRRDNGCFYVVELFKKEEDREEITDDDFLGETHVDLTQYFD